MAKLRAISISSWGEGGVQITFQALSPVAGFEVNHIEMAMPVNETEFKRLAGIKLYDEFDVTVKKV